MKPKLPPFFPALLAALLLPGAALVGCKSADTANPETAPENGDAVGDGIKIVRPDSAAAEGNATGATGDAGKPAEIVGTPVDEEKAPKGLRLFGKRKTNPEADMPPADVAEEEAKAAESQPVAADVPTPKRKPLFSRRSKDKGAEETAGEEAESAPEIAATGEKKKFRLFGFGKKKDKAAESDGAPAGAEAVVAENGKETGTAGKEKEVPAVDRNPERLPWDESEREIAGSAAGNAPDPESFDGLLAPGVRADGSATGVTARIRPSDATGGIAPAPAPVPDESPLDSVPSVTDEPPITRPRDDGFVPLTPEPKFPGAEEILPPGN